MKPVIFHSGAEIEIHAGVEYYEDQAPSLAMDFQAEIERVIRRIEHDPGQFPPHGEQGIC